MFASGDVIEEHDLSVLVSLNLNALRSVAWWVIRVYIDHLAVALVPEKKPRI